MDRSEAKRSVIRVGAGRGFIVHGEHHHRYVITAAHCLPNLPPCMSFSGLEERTYKALLGPLGKKPTVWAECLFVDPISDLAVLGSPDKQELSDQADAYEALTEAAMPLSIAGSPKTGWQRANKAWLFSLDRRWFGCVIRHNGGGLCIFDAAEEIAGGMSGSPIIDDKGSAIGVVCMSSTLGGREAGGGPNPNLTENLPVWFLQKVWP
jgi:hypothetical protein